MEFKKVNCPRCNHTDVRYVKTTNLTWCRYCGYEWENEKKEKRE